MRKIAILDDYQGVMRRVADWSRLPADFSLTVFEDHLDDEDAVAARLADFEVVVMNRERTPFPRALLARLPNLRLLITNGMRNLSIDLAAAAEHGITVCGTRGRGNATPELTWGLILSLLRHIPHEDRGMREGGWQTTLGRELAGATLGIVGLGRIGAQVAKVGLAFGMDVIAWSPNLSDERAAEVGIARADKESLFAEADVITLHLVLSDRSRGIVGGEDIGRMKRTAFLINTSRGPLIDEEALLRALQNGDIAGAGLDVYDVEPLPGSHPFRALPNTVLTPHLGYVTEENYRTGFGDAVENILAWADGSPVRVLSEG
ncbi:MAG: D-2-hydroxyacid dehydrogenase family protein [Alphaproteobacteria bacterium]|jgi:phosphoglycerate dehydrogenase-like enzyme|nr:D-2-hydroxyacid dehydrogenase family protein [Alphaproteobacteria bacterium]